MLQKYAIFTKITIIWTISNFLCFFFN